MKIAVLASGQGEKALYLYNFFKEGNRVTVDCLISDKEDSPAQEAMRSEGVETFTFPHAEWEGEGDTITSFLKSRGVEVVVVDDLESAVPKSVLEAYGEAVITPSGVHEAPGEVVALYNRLTRPAPGKKPERDPNVPPTLEEEWAEALKIDYDPEEAEARAVVPPEIDTSVTAEMNQGQPPVEPAPQPVQQQGYNFGQPYMNRPMENGPLPEREPMPDTYLVWSVLATVLCCMIPGIIAIIFSSSVSSRYYAGDMEGAKRASKRAQIWIIVSIVTGIVWFTLYMPLMLIVG